MKYLLLAVLMLLPFAAAADNYPRDAASVGSYTIDHTKIGGYLSPADSGLFPVDTSSWTVIDMTNGTGGGSAAGAMAALGCTGANIATADDSIDDADAIRCAIANLPGSGGRVLYLPAGQFDLTSSGGTSCWFTLSRSQTVLRGAGRAATKLFGNSAPGSGLPFWFGPTCNDSINYSTTNSTTWTPKTAGQTVITLGSSAGYAIGDWIYLPRSEDCHGDVGVYEDCHEVRKITNVSGNDVTLNFPTRDDVSGLGAVNAGKITPTYQIGVEDVHLKHNYQTVIYGVAEFNRCLQCWMTGSKVERGFQSLLELNHSAYVWISGNIFERTMNVNHSNRGIRLQALSESWIENNALINMPIGIEMDVIGSQGTQFLFNYMKNPPGQQTTCQPSSGVDECTHNGTTCICYGGAQPAATRCYDGYDNTSRHIFFHGFRSRWNLLEGNDTTCRVQWDAFWGNPGPGNVWHRGRTRRIATQARLYDTGCLGQEFGTGYEKFIVLGYHSPLLQSCIDSSGIDQGGTDQWHEKNIAPVDCFRTTASTANGTVDCGLSGGSGSSTNQFTDVRELDAAPAAWIDTEVYPSSFSYESAPSWWCQEACSWDAEGGIGAFGDDYNVGSPNYCKLPAQIRYEGGTCTPLSAGADSVFRGGIFRGGTLR